MKNTISIIGGIVSIVTLLVLNFNHASNNYGVVENNLHIKVLAQTSSSDGGGICNWATREVSNGWEAVCIKGGPGYSCTCGETKFYPGSTWYK